MQFKLMSVLATALSVQTACAMSSTQQGQAQQQSEMSQQIHQLEQLAHEIHMQQMTQLHQLDIGLPALNASAITGILSTLTNGVQNAGNSVTTVANFTAAQQLPAIVNAVSGLAGSIVTNGATLVTTPSTVTLSQPDQLALINGLSALVNAITAFITNLVGPNGLIANPLVIGPFKTVLNLIVRAIINIAGAIVARTPAYATQAQALLSQLQGSLALTINF